MKIFGTSDAGSELLLILFSIFGLVMAFVYHDGGYFHSEPILVLGGCCAGIAFCLVRLFRGRRGSRQSNQGDTNTSDIPPLTSKSVVTMSSKVWGVIGMISCVGLYEVLRDKFGKSAAYFFAGLTIIAWITSSIFYRRLLGQIKQQISDLPPDKQREALEAIDPEIREDIQKAQKGDGQNGKNNH